MRQIQAFFFILLVWPVTSPSAVTAEDLEIRRVTDGVYAALQPEARRFNDSNTVFIVGTRDVIVVDTQASSETARQLIASLRKLTDKPARYLVHTHWHGDHTQSNKVWLAAFPGLEILTHASLAEDIPGRTVPAIEDEIGRYTEGIKRAEGWLESGLGPDGEALTDDLRSRLPAELERARQHLHGLRGLDIAPPTLTYDRRLILDRGRRVELLHFRAHSRGDTVVHLPDEKILITGDLLDDLPYGGHGYPSSWIAALDALEALAAQTVIPGHGGVFEGVDQLRRVRAFLRAVLEGARSAATAGRSLDELRAELDVSEHRSALAGNDPVAQRTFDAFLPELVERAWLDVRGELDTEDQDP